MMSLEAPEFNAPGAVLLPMTPPSRLDATSRDFMAATLFVLAAMKDFASAMMRRLPLSGSAALAQSGDAAETRNR